jgi:hypothetical protein
VPARVFLLSNTPTRLAVDRLVTWDALMPNRLEQALLRTGGVLPLSRSELARVFPDLWPTPKAVERWLAHERQKGPQTLILDSYWGLGPLSEATAVTYRRAGQSRGSPHRAVLPGRVEDAAAAGAALAVFLGEVEQVQVVERLRRSGADAETAPPTMSRRRDVSRPPAHPRTPPLGPLANARPRPPRSPPDPPPAGRHDRR